MKYNILIIVLAILTSLITIPVMAQESISNTGTTVYTETTLEIIESPIIPEETPIELPTTIPEEQPSFLESISKLIFGLSPTDSQKQPEQNLTKSAMISEDADGSMMAVLPSNIRISDVTDADYTNKTIPSVKRENVVDFSSIDFTQDVIAVRIVSGDMVYIIRRG